MSRCTLLDCCLITAPFALNLPLQEQINANGINLEAFKQPAVSDANAYLADQMTNSTKAAEEYDPEDLYDPSENL